MTTDYTLSRPAAPFDLAKLIAIATIAAVVNLAVFWIGSAIGASMRIDSPAYQEITIVMSGATTLVPLVIAGVITWLIARRWPGFRRVALWAGLALAIASMVSPFVVALDTPTALSLAAMHVVAGTAWFLAVSSPAGERKAA